MALIKLSCNILDLLKHNSNYICMRVVPQLTIMRYFHHFSFAAGFEKCNNADRNNREICGIDLQYMK